MDGLPYLGTEPPWFSFLVHPRDEADLRRFGGAKLISDYSTNTADFQAKVCTMKPLIIGRIQFGFDPLWGELVAAIRMPEEIFSRRGVKHVREALEVAAGRHARFIGLGALTSSITGGGERLLKTLPPGIVLTNGNAFTAFTVAQNVLAAATCLPGNPKVAIVGCTGSVGIPTTQLLADAGLDLILFGRSKQRVEARLGSLAKRFPIGNGAKSMREADIVVLLTSDPKTSIDGTLLHSGAIVIDCCEPPCCFKSSADIHIIKGGLVQIPNYTSTWDFNLPFGTFACLAETYLFAREGIPESSVGIPSSDFARYMGRVAQRHNIKPLALDLPSLSQPLPCHKR